MYFSSTGCMTSLYYFHPLSFLFVPSPVYILNSPTPTLFLVLTKYSLRPKILVIEMDVSRCSLVLDTSILMTSNSGRREYLVQTRNKVGVGEFSMYIGLGTNRKERG